VLRHSDAAVVAGAASQYTTRTRINLAHLKKIPETTQIKEVHEFNGSDQSCPLVQFLRPNPISNRSGEQI